MVDRALLSLQRSQLNETNIRFHIHDPDDADFPSQKFGIDILLGIFLCFIIVAGLIGMAILCCSRCQEKAKSDSNEKKEQNQTKDFRDNVQCRPYSEWGNEDKNIELTEAFDSSDEYATASSSEEDSEISEIPRCDELECGHKVKTVCALCCEAFENGQPIYRSNNSQCQHEFHMVCMNKWLNIQNTCPTCNQPFILDTV